MMSVARMPREHAVAIWRAGVAAVEPLALVRSFLVEPSLRDRLRAAPRILVVGGGKAAAAMAAGVESALADQLDRLEGILNVPAESVQPLKKLRLHAARPAGTNQRTAEGVAGTQEILALVRSAGPEDVCLCLLSGGGSALLPAPAPDITLADKQNVTLALHHCGASIDEMNCVRKHLSAIKGGRLVQAFAGRAPFSLILSDVIGDPLDVIASGPTAADPTTFADALAVLKRFHLDAHVPPAVLRHLQAGVAGVRPETLKALPGGVHNTILGNNARALAAAQNAAVSLGYRVLQLGSFIDGETREAAALHAALVRSIRADGQPLPPPVCLLSGGETTVTLGTASGRGGRNQEFVLAALLKLGAAGMRDVVLLSGGTDGEDGPTDAAGALADANTPTRAADKQLAAADHLKRHDAYSFFDATGDLLRTGLTQTNVMDLRVILVC